MRKTVMLGSVALLLSLGTAQAAEPASCATVRMAEPGWSDLAFTTGTASVILKALGYGAESQVLGIPVIYQAMENKQLDVFLGYWDPAMESYFAEFKARGTVETLQQNLSGAKYTWATLKPAYDAGLHDVKDVAAFKDKLDGKIYGIEPGSNQLMLDMIADPQYGLAGFDLVESSEQGMLAEVTRAEQKDGFIVFQAWAPHPMNLAHDIAYLTGADDYYGPDFGGASVHTQVRQGYTAECPNVAALLSNLTFTIEQESAGMAYILDQGMAPEDAASEALLADPTVLAAWLKGVTTRDGGDGLAAVKAALGL